MNVVSFSFDKDLFTADSNAAQRQRALAQSLASLHIIVFTKRSQKFGSLQLSQNVVVYPTHAPSRFLIPVYALSVALSLKTRPDVVMAQDPFVSGALAYLVAKVRHAKLMVQEHGDFFSTPHWREESLGNRLWSFVGMWILRRAQCIRVVSLRIKKTLVHLGIDEKKITVFPVETNLEVAGDLGSKKKTQASIDLHKKYGMDAQIILSMARFVPQKNLTLLITAFVMLANECPKTHLVLVGVGSEQKKLERLIHASKMEDRIHIEGWSDDPLSYMQSSDVYALSSNYEGWGRVLIEAMFAGLPIVTTDVGCVGEVIYHEKEALVVPVGDTKALSGALARVLKDESLREQLRERGSKTIEAMPKEAYTNRYKELFALCLQ